MKPEPGAPALPVLLAESLMQKHTRANTGRALKGNPTFSVAKMTTSFFFQVVFSSPQLRHLAEVPASKTSRVPKAAQRRDGLRAVTSWQGPPQTFLRMTQQPDRLGVRSSVLSTP